MSLNLKDRILQTLVEEHKINQVALEEALMPQKSGRARSFGRILIDKGFINDKTLLTVFIKETGLPFMNLNKFKVDPSLVDVVPEKFARQYKMLPIAALHGTITVAVSDPLDAVMVNDLQNISGRSVTMFLALESDIIRALDALYGTGIASVSDISKDFEPEALKVLGDDDDKGDSNNEQDGEQAPIIKVVNLVIKESLKQRASDIHIEPMVDCMRVRYRIDGILRDILKIPKKNQNAVLVRIKIMAKLDITSSQVPQDGRFKMKLGNKDVDFRVSLLPTSFGQKVVMRILDRTSLSIGLRGLGMSEKSQKVLEEGIRRPYGMILITGPTGSGKSTTLYSLVSILNTVERNIITVEDPVEYLIDGLTQIQTHTEIGFTFAEGLRAILRQSPDVVMVGEIRDGETADIAIKAALTGQIVLSTLHTNDAPGALTRLVDMGVEPFLVASSVIVVSAQRLARKICLQCKEPYDIPAEVIKSLDFKLPKDVQFYRGKGCNACNGTGYKGRMSITEVLEVDTHVREMILLGKTSDEIKEYAQGNGSLVTLFEDAMDKASAGLTTLEEVLRVTTSD